MLLVRDSQADATGGISVALSVCPYAQSKLATVLVFPVITAGGRGLGVDGRNRSAAPRPVLPVHGVTTPSPLQSSYFISVLHWPR